LEQERQPAPGGIRQHAELVEHPGTGDVYALAGDWTH